MVPWRPEPAPFPVPVPDLEAEVCAVTKQASVRSQTSLSSELAPKLLRGVALDSCLQCWGAHFSESASLEGYQLSRETECINQFLSHDWKTPRWSKTLALLVFYNSVPAAVATICVSSVTCGLLLSRRLPGGWPTASISTYSTFLIFFCFGQRLRRLACCSVPMVFLDRLCIAQHDEELKRQGILGLAGFLLKSQKLLILWTPRTFTRVWCTFELAHFLRPGGDSKRVEILPVAMMSLLILTCAVNFIFWCFFHVWVYIEELGSMGMDGFYIVALAGGILSPSLLLGMSIQIHFGIQYMKDLENLEGQMKGFSIRQAECSCCDLNHVHPQTGVSILCDRSLVFKTLRRWYPAGPGDDHLDCILPQYIHMGLDHIRVYPHVSAEWNFWQWIAQFAMVPLVTMFFFWLCNFGAWSGARLSFSKWTSLLTVLILNFCLLGAFWLPMAVASFPKIPQKMLPVLAVMLSVLLGLYTRQYGCVSCGTLAQRGLRLLRWR
ncbi:unnamed protein product [Durusdinium trenchii]|uniref:Uncharacterized protein n=1 Tax=Durusdinium trenchii TaxID=1381693 RepID=A0ABP0RT04_9DINO